MMVSSSFPALRCMTRVYSDAVEERTLKKEHRSHRMRLRGRGIFRRCPNQHMERIRILETCNSCAEETRQLKVLMNMRDRRWK